MSHRKSILYHLNILDSDDGEILDDYDELTMEDIQACLEFAANREHMISSIRAA